MPYIFQPVYQVEYPVGSKSYAVRSGGLMKCRRGGKFLRNENSLSMSCPGHRESNYFLSMYPFRNGVLSLLYLQLYF